MLFKSISNIFKKKNKKVVYTAITGDYDDLLTPSYVNDNWDYICFTDNENIESDFWQIKIMKDLDMDNQKKNRIYKVLPHKYLRKYDYSLYIDGNFMIIGDIDEYVTRFSKGKAMMCMIHPQRNCIYDEADACIDLQKDSAEVIRKQIKKYQLDKYPKDNGLNAGGILFRKHNDPSLIKVMNTWWNEIKTHSYRDQLSFNYACWKTGFSYDKCNLSIWKNEYFQHRPHIKKTN